MNYVCLVWYLLFSVCIARAQPDGLISIHFQQPITNVCPDQSGDFYVLLRNGSLKKYNPEGTLLHQIKINNPSYPKTIMAVRFFFYQPAQRQYTWLTSSLNPIETTPLDSVFAIQPLYISPESIQNLWIYDAVGPWIRKVNTYTWEIEQEFTPIHTEPIQSMHFYQQMLFVEYPGTISIYDRLGHFIHQIKTQSHSKIQFIGEEMYYTKNKKLYLFNLYTSDLRHLPLPSSCPQAILLEKKIVCIHPQQIDIMPFSTTP